MVALACIAIGVSAAALTTHPSSDKNNTPNSSVSSGSSPVQSANSNPSVSSSQNMVGNTSSSSGLNPTSTNAATRYVASVCTKTHIVPHKTSYQITFSLGPGKVEILEYKDGYTLTCTADSTGYKPIDHVFSPVDNVIFVGDGGASGSVENPPRTKTYDQAYTVAASTCSPDLSNGGGNTAYQMCIASMMHHQGY